MSREGNILIIPIALLAVIGIAATTATVYFYRQNKEPAPTTSRPPQQAQSPISTPPASLLPPAPTQSATPSSLLPPPVTPDPTANWKTYTNSRHGYTFKYPSDLLTIKELDIEDCKSADGLPISGCQGVANKGDVTYVYDKTERYFFAIRVAPLTTSPLGRSGFDASSDTSPEIKNIQIDGENVYLMIYPSAIVGEESNKAFMLASSYSYSYKPYGKYLEPNLRWNHKSYSIWIYCSYGYPLSLFEKVPIILSTLKFL